jgi:orotidine-5'-phosphate decarboxylase
MKNKFTAQERLFVAADFEAGLSTGRRLTRVQILSLAKSLKGTGVGIKVNSDLRAIGIDLIHEIHALGLPVFADLKIVDIDETMGRDGRLLQEARPEILTVMCVAGDGGMRHIMNALPDTEVIGVTVLTSLDDAASQKRFGCNVNQAVERFALVAKEAFLHGVVASAKEALMIRGIIGDKMTINTPAIRPAWSVVAGDDQNAKRIVTPKDAIRLSADRIIVGRPIVQDPNPLDAVMRTLDEITAAIES